MVVCWMRYLFYRSTGVNLFIQASAFIPSQVTNSSPNSRSGLKSSVQKVVHQFRGSKLSKHYPLRDECEVTKRCSDKVLLQLVKLYHCNKV